MKKMKCLFVILAALLNDCSTFNKDIDKCTLKQTSTNLSLVDKFKWYHKGLLHRMSTLMFNSSKCLLKVVVTRKDIPDNVIITGMPTDIICQAGSNAGLRIRGVTNLVLKDLSLSGCGVDHDGARRNGTFRFAVYIVDSINVALQSVTISRSSGTGLVMLNNGGFVYINDSIFEQNSLQNVRENVVLSGAGGVYVELSYRGNTASKNTYGLDNRAKIILNSTYHITNSTFFKNYNRNLNTTSAHAKYYARFGKGGGMAVIIRNSSGHNNIIIDNCTFSSNVADSGAGLFVAIKDESSGSRVLVNNSKFLDNICITDFGSGGGVSAGFVITNTEKKIKNCIIFDRCHFLNNNAPFGGGGNFYFSNKLSANNSIRLSACNWTNNSAFFGAAIKASPHPFASDSKDTRMTLTIKDNQVSSNVLRTDSRVFITKRKGAVLVEKCKMVFLGTNLFEHNTGSALSLYSSQAIFSDNSHTNFTKNRGYQGGAVSLTGSSFIKFYNDSTFLFDSNCAQDGGGAIFAHASSSLDIEESRTCFVQHAGNQNRTEDYNTSFTFKNNSGTLRGRSNTQLSHFGHSILATTMKPCIRTCQDMTNLTDVFSCIGNFTFVDRNPRDLSTFENDVTTSAANITAVPGKPVNLNLIATDEFSHEVAAVYHVFVKSDSRSPVTIGDVFSYISGDNSNIRFYGRPGSKATLHVETTSIRSNSLEIAVVLDECPPGLILNDRPRCICASKTDHAYQGLSPCCNDSHFQAYLKVGYWIGYDTTNPLGKHSELIFSHCHYWECIANYTTQVMLPNNTNTSILNTLICGIYRSGRFCSKCKSNLFMHYHSRTFSCSPSPDRCQLGWLYYILSELLPVTVFFVIIVLFDVRLASGSINGFILFVQLTDALKLRENGYIRFPPIADWLLNVYYFFAGIFNLDFFETEQLSYCLWKTANAVDLLAFKYVTLLYALTLIITLIIFMRYCNVNISRVIPVKFLKTHLSKKSAPIIHGISGFLIICYSEATKISLLLLTPANIYSFGNKSGIQVKYVVSSGDGDLLFFKGRHLLYALPALFVLGVLGLAPPLLLFAYPLCYKLFGVLRISESVFIKVLCILIPLEKCKPFFDSFQSGFKDECRFFAGMYFLYRLTILTTLAILGGTRYYHISIALQFLAMTVLHAIFQPHRNRRQNNVDGLLFANLGVISLLTMLNYLYDSLGSQFYIAVSTSIQVLLLYLPLGYVFICVGRKALRGMYVMAKHIKEQKTLNRNPTNYQRFSSLLEAADDRSL